MPGDTISGAHVGPGCTSVGGPEDLAGARGDAEALAVRKCDTADQSVGGREGGEDQRREVDSVGRNGGERIANRGDARGDRHVLIVSRDFGHRLRHEARGYIPAVAIDRGGNVSAKA